MHVDRVDHAADDGKPLPLRAGLNAIPALQEFGNEVEATHLAALELGIVVDGAAPLASSTTAEGGELGQSPPTRCNRY